MKFVDDDDADDNDISDVYMQMWNKTLSIEEW